MAQYIGTRMCLPNVIAVIPAWNEHLHLGRREAVAGGGPALTLVSTRTDAQVVVDHAPGLPLLRACATPCSTFDYLCHATGMTTHCRTPMRCSSGVNTSSSGGAKSRIGAATATTAEGSKYRLQYASDSLAILRRA